MREIFQIKIIDPKGEQLLPLKSGAMNNRIRAQALEKFEIVEIATAKAPKKVLAQRSGNDQVVKVIDELGGEEFDLVIEDFHTVNASLWGGNDAGMLQQYRMVSDTQLSQLVLGDGSRVAGFMPSFTPNVLTGAGVLGVAAAVVGGGGGGGGGNSPSVRQPEMRLSVDTGTSNTDGVTNVSTVNISNLKSGSTWEYQVDGGAWIIGSGTSFNLTNGTHDYRIRETDTAGSRIVTNAKTMTLDTNAVDTAVTYRSMVKLEPLNQALGSDEMPQIAAVSPHGDYVVTWTGPNSSNMYSVFVQKFHADGTTTGFPLVEIPARYINIPRSKVCKLSSDGTYVVTWQASDSGADESIFVQRFNANGTVNGAPVVVEAIGVTNNVDEFPAVAALGSNGAFVVTWRGIDTLGDYSVFVQQFNADGTTTGRNRVQLDSFAGGTDVEPPDIAAVGTNGAYAVTWVGEQVNNAGRKVFVQRFNPDGSTNENPLHTPDITLNYGDNSAPQITAIGTQGAFAVVFTGCDIRSGNFGIFVQPFDASGSPLDLVRLRNLSALDGQSASVDPSIASLGTDGAFVITWLGVDNQGDPSIFVQQFNADGSITGRSIVQLEALNLTTGADATPKVSSIGVDGSYVVVWYGDGTAGSSIFVQRFNADGSITGHDIIQLDAPNYPNGRDVSPEVTAIGTDGAFAVTWTGEDSDGESSIFVQQFNADGLLRQDKVAIDIAAGQDRWLGAQEDSVNLTIRYAELAQGDVIQLREAGANIGVAHTVTAAEVAAGFVVLQLQRAHLAGGGSNGSHAIKAVITDLAGNVSAETPVALNLEVLTTVPSAAVINATSGDDILNNQDYLAITGTGGAPVLISGTKQAGASIHLTIDDKTYILFANAGTTWNYALSAADVVSKSTMIVSVVQRDAAGNSSAAVTRTLMIDTTAAAPSLQLAADTGSSNTDGVTNSAIVNVVGLEAGATWKYQIDGGNWQPGNGTSFSLVDGRHVYNIQQTDAVGNSSETTLSSRTFELDTLNDQNMSVAIPAKKFEAITNADGYDYNPHITTLGIGRGYVLAWQGWDGIDNNIYTQQFNANGTTTGFTPVQLEAIGITNRHDEIPQITVIDNTGKYVVTWTGYESSYDTSIYVQQFNANGTTAGYTQVLLEAIGVTDKDDDLQQVCAVGDGKYVVVWHGVDTAGDRSVFVQQFNANGTTTGYARVQLEAPGNLLGFDTDPQIASVGSNGQYAVTWSGEDSGGGDLSVYVQQFNANGTTAGFPVVKLESPDVTDGLDIGAQITALGSDGDYVVAWYGRGSANSSNMNIYVQRFNGNGTTKGALIKIESPLVNSTFVENPQIVSVGTEGAFVVVWDGVNPNSSTSQIAVQQFNADGTTGSSTQFDVYVNTFGPDTKPQVASIGNEGAYVVVWSAEDSSRPPGAFNKTVFVQQFRPDGSTAGLNTVKLKAPGVTSGLDLTPQVTALGNDGSYLVTWSGFDGGDNSIYIQQFNGDGTPRQSLVNVQMAAGQDQLLSWSETSATLEVSYSGMSEGQTIEFFESGVSLGVTHTVTAANVSAGRASVVVQKDDLGGSRDYLLSVKVADLAGNFSAESPVVIALTVDRPASVISLGAGKGQLINGVQVEGKWFYTWDRNADGALSSLNDAITLDGLATTFLGSGKSGADFTAVDRTFTINGVRLALPTVGIDTPPATSTQMNGTAWSKSTFRSSSTPNSNPTYDDLLAVWDAFNGTSTGQNGLGVPPGWDANLAYWSANATSGANHYVSNMHGVVDINSNLNQNFAVFQVL